MSYQDWNWANAQLRISLAQQHSGDAPALAQTYFEEALAKLKDEHPSEIREQGLHGLLARVYLLENKRDKALFHATHAVELNPERAWERSVLGEVYFVLNDYERAEDEWHTGLNLDPTDSNILNQIASAYQSRGVALRHPEERRQAFSRVLEMLGHALEILESDAVGIEKSAEHLQACGLAHYWLGQFHRNLMHYDEAIPHLRAAQPMGFKPLETQVALGWTYMEAKAYDEVEQVFSRTLAEAHQQHQKVKVSTQPADAPGEDRPINDLLVEAYFFRAFAHAERGMKFTQPLRLLRHIERRIALTKDKSQQTQYRAVLHDCLGLAHLRNGDVAQAITELEQSVALRASGVNASGGPYYRLAQAYLARAQVAVADRNHWLERARYACIHCRETDLMGGFVQPIADLLCRLDALTAPKAEGTAQETRIIPQTTLS